MLYWLLGEFPNFVQALYFSAVTATTLGYGDIIMSEHWQLMGTFESMGGLILFGVSTAFLIEIMRQAARQRLPIFKRGLTIKQIQPDLWQCAKYSPSILSTHAYFLERPEGNVLFYNTGDSEDLQHIEDLGGVQYQLLTHRDEAAESLARIKARFGSKLGYSEIEAPFIERYAPPDLTFAPGDHKLGDIDVIETPGHTNGSVCFFYKSPHGKSYLFTGDTLFQNKGEWSTFVLTGYSGTKESLARSLTKLRGLAPDIVMSSGFVGEIAYREIEDGQWHAIIDEQIRRLK